MTRLSRKVLIALAGVVCRRRISAADLCAATARADQAAPELYNTDAQDHGRRPRRSAARLHRPAEDVPQLGPPLARRSRPADPRRAGTIAAPAGSRSTEEQRHRPGERGGAHERSCSPRQMSMSVRRRSPTTATARPAHVGTDARRADGTAADRSQCHPEHAGSQARLPQRARRSPHRQPRSLGAARPRPMSCRPARSFRRRSITGIRSDLPGQITAQVTENVYDSPTGASSSSRRARS